MQYESFLLLNIIFARVLKISLCEKQKNHNSQLQQTSVHSPKHFFIFTFFLLFLSMLFCKRPFLSLNFLQDLFVSLKVFLYTQLILHLSSILTYLSRFTNSEVLNKLLVNLYKSIRKNIINGYSNSNSQFITYLTTY